MAKATALDWCPVKEINHFCISSSLKADPKELNKAHHDMRIFHGCLIAAKALGQPLEVLRPLAEQYIDSNYKYQKMRWGKIKYGLSVPSLLR